MVTTGISMADVMPAAVSQTVSPRDAEFMQTLQTEMSAGEAVALTDGTALHLIPENLTPQLEAQLAAVLKNVLTQAQQQEEDGNVKLLELIMKLLGKDKDKDEDKKEPLIEQPELQLNDRIAMLLMKLLGGVETETPKDAQTEEQDVVLAAAEIAAAEPIVAEQNGTVYVQPEAEKPVQTVKAQATEETAVQQPTAAAKTAEHGTPIRMQLPIDGETAELAQPVEVKKAEAPRNVFAIRQPEQTTAQAAEKTLQQLAQETVETLKSLVAAATGQETEVSEKTEAPQTRFIFVKAAPVKTQETDDELNQLMAGIEGRRTETRTAVKMPQELLQQVYTAQTEQAPVAESGQTALHPTEQVAQAVTAHLTQHDGETEFTMTLTPEELGRVDVKIVSAEGKITVEITAHSEKAAEMLNQRFEHLQTSLKENGVELEKYQVVYSPEETATQHQDDNGSSKNPYGGQKREKQDEDAPEFSQLLDEIAV